jgi:hypothetical protein
MTIISRYFNTEIATIDVQTKEVMHFGQDLKGVQSRCILCYNGIHYDVFVMGTVPTTDHTFGPDDVALFPINDEIPLVLAMEQVDVMNAKNMFVDPNHMSMKCKICAKIFPSQDAAFKHLSTTGHTQFDEVREGE